MIIAVVDKVGEFSPKWYFDNYETLSGDILGKLKWL